MNDKEKSYCRLCANLKSNNKLINLLVDEDRRSKIIDKLIRFNISIELSESILPKTVCLPCISSLDKAFDFIIDVEKAQDVLRDVIIREIKTETAHTDDFAYSPQSHKDDGDFAYSPPSSEKYEFSIKEEIENSNATASLSDERKLKKIKKERRKERVKSDIDTIPLSQLKLTWKDYSWKCAYCETEFPTVDELQEHSIQYHQCCNAYRCNDCNIRKLRLDSFLSHVKRHRKYLKFSCYKCFERFPKAIGTRLHKNVHRKSNFICTGCNHSFSSPEEQTQHSSELNRDKRVRPIPKIQDMNDLTCTLCHKTFKYRGSLNTHLLIHTERKRDHTCDKCGKCFFNKQNLAGHMLLHDDVRPYQCEICKFRFRTPGQLRMHVGVHDNIKPFSCDQCGRCFRLSKQLESHKIIHTDTLPYTCPYCSKGFRFKTILNQHLRQHTGVKPYTCTFCQRDFTNWPNYNKHMKRRHGLDMAKKKHTPDGVYPINPTTGEIVIHETTHKTIEWKKKVLGGNRRPGRPKLSNKDPIFEAMENKEDKHSPLMSDVTQNQEEMGK